MVAADERSGCHKSKKTSFLKNNTVHPVDVKTFQLKTTNVNIMIELEKKNHQLNKAIRIHPLKTMNVCL